MNNIIPNVEQYRTRILAILQANLSESVQDARIVDIVAEIFTAAGYSENAYTAVARLILPNPSNVSQAIRNRVARIVDDGALPFRLTVGCGFTEGTRSVNTKTEQKRERKTEKSHRASVKTTIALEKTGNKSEKAAVITRHEREQELHKRRVQHQAEDVLSDLLYRTFDALIDTDIQNIVGRQSRDVLVYIHSWLIQAIESGRLNEPESAAYRAFASRLKEQVNIRFPESIP